MPTDPNQPTPQQHNQNVQQQQRQQQQRNARDEAMKKRLQEHAIKEDDPRVKPYIDDLKTRQETNKQARDDRETSMETARTRYDEANSRLQAASEAVANAQREMEEATRARSEAYDQLNTFYAQPPLAGPTAAEQLAPGEPTVWMFFPRETRLIHEHGHVTFPAGIHPVPESVQTHPFLWNSGARLYTGNTENFGQGTERPPSSSPARVDPKAQAERGTPPRGGTDGITRRE